MWLLRFHLVETRDYNKIDRIVAKTGYVSRNLSTMVLVKGILLHVLQKKSWRQAGAELKVSYTALYQFAQFFESREEKKELLSYLIERKIALYIANEGHITMDVLSGDEIVQESLLELNRRV